MSTFRIYVDGLLFFHPSISSLAITEAELTEDASSIDSFKLSVPKEHPYVESIKPLTSQLILKQNDRTVFIGRAIDDGEDFYKTRTWTCESCLAYLKDTRQKPFDYQGPLKGLLELLLKEHNEHVESRKQIQPGTITVKDNNDYVHYSSTEYLTTLDAIKEKLIQTHGGYLYLRYEDDKMFLDYLADFDEESAQVVEYGKNLLDVMIERDFSARVSALIPFGAVTTQSTKVGEAETRLDITSVNGDVNYIFDQKTVDEIGWVWSMETWDDVTLPTNLLKKAQSRLAELKDGIISMELSIIDESETGADINDIHAREYVYCRSQEHGINGKYLVISRTIDFLNPSNDKITIGAKGVSLTSAINELPTRGPRGKPGINGQDGVVLKISSSNGLVFKNDQLSTVLTASVFYGAKTITDIVTLKECFGQSAFLQWEIISEDGNTVTSINADDGRIGKGGFSLSLSAADISQRATINCSLQTA